MSLVQPLTVVQKLLKVVVQVTKQPGVQPMAIPSVIQGTIEADGGRVFELDSPKGSAWLKSATSFRFEPTGANKPYTVRREKSGYWYGCRKIAGKVRKKYIGKTSEVSTAKLEEIAATFEVPPTLRVNKVIEGVAEEVAEVAQDRFAALELEVADLRKALEVLAERLPGKSEVGDTGELPKIDNEVVEELQNELSNLKGENEYLKQKLAESRDTIETLNWGTSALEKQLENGKVEVQRWEEAFSELQGEKDDLEEILVETKQQYSTLVSSLNQELASVRLQLETLKAENETLRATSSVAEFELPEASVLLNRLKAKRKKATASLADIEAILEILEE